MLSTGTALSLMKLFTTFLTIPELTILILSFHRAITDVHCVPSRYTTETATSLQRLQLTMHNSLTSYSVEMIHIFRITHRICYSHIKKRNYKSLCQSVNLCDTVTKNSSDSRVTHSHCSIHIIIPSNLSASLYRI